MKKSIDLPTNSVTFSFDQTSAPGALPIIFDITKVSAKNREYAALHGFSARIGDNAALSRDPKTGKSPTELERREAILELVTFYENLANEDWSQKGAAKKPAQNDPNTLKVMAKRGCTYEEAQAIIADLMVEMLAE